MTSVSPSDISSQLNRRVSIALNKRKTTTSQLAGEARVHPSIVSKMLGGNSGGLTLNQIQQVLEHIGYTLQVVKKQS